MFKIYYSEKDIYCSLIIHLDGNIECIIENNLQEMYKEEIQLLINQCNQLIERINTNKFYSFYEIIQFNDDALTNLHSDTQIDFLDCGLIFSKEQFQSKGNVFPDCK